MTGKPMDDELDPRHVWCAELKPPGYLTPARAPMGRRGRRVTLHVGRAERRLADPAPEQAPFDLTGRYQDGAALGVGDGPQYLMHVNQAGRRLEGMFTELPAGPEPRVLRFWGEMSSEGQVAIASFVDGELTSGKLSRSSDFVLAEIGVAGWPKLLSFKRREPRATFIDQSLAFALDVQSEELGSEDSQVTKAVREQEFAPLTDAQMAVIREVFEPTKIGRLIDAAVVGSGVNTFEAVERANAIEAFDVEVARALRLNAWPQSQHNLVLEFARYVLVKQPHTVRGATKPSLPT